MKMKEHLYPGAKLEGDEPLWNRIFDFDFETKILGLFPRPGEIMVLIQNRIAYSKTKTTHFFMCLLYYKCYSSLYKYITDANEISNVAVRWWWFQTNWPLRAQLTVQQPKLEMKEENLNYLLTE